MLSMKDVVEFSYTLPNNIERIADVVPYMEKFLREKGIYRDGLNNCVEIAESLLSLFSMTCKQTNGVPFGTACVTIKPMGNSILDGLKIKDSLGEIHSYTHHTVFIPEFHVVDIQHGYSYESINDYFEMLYELNGSIRFDYSLSFFTNYHFEDGIKDLSKICNIDYLANLK